MKKYKTIKLYKEERMLFFTASFVLCLVFASYIYFVSASVVHVVMRKEINQEIASLSSYVSRLESKYIDSQHKVSNDIASMDGFVEVNEKIFIDRTETSLVLSGNNGS